MKLILEDENFLHIKTISFNSLKEIENFLPVLKDQNKFLNGTLLTLEDNISCYELRNFKLALSQINISLNQLFTSSRETNIAAKYLKIETHFSFSNGFKKSPSYFKKSNHDDITHIGLVRSGEKISSNGNLIIIGDVNAGAQINAKKNIYVWGKLCGVAFAGREGEESSFIASLYLNPLQLRINKAVAIGPKEKPIDNYPEIAILHEGKILIKPLLINK